MPPSDDDLDITSSIAPGQEEPGDGEDLLPEETDDGQGDTAPPPERVQRQESAEPPPPFTPADLARALGQPPAPQQDPYAGLSDADLQLLAQAGRPGYAEALAARRTRQSGQQVVDHATQAVEQLSWDAVVIQQYPWLRETSSAHFARFRAERERLLAQGYKGADINRIAAMVVDPDVRRDTHMERDRERRGEGQARQFSSSGRGNPAARRDETDDAMALTPNAERMRQEWGINTPEGRKVLADELQVQGRRARRHANG